MALNLTGPDRAFAFEDGNYPESIFIDGVCYKIKYSSPGVPMTTYDENFNGISSRLLTSSDYVSYEDCDVCKSTHYSSSSSLSSSSSVSSSSVSSSSSSVSSSSVSSSSSSSKSSSSSSGVLFYIYEAG